MFLSSNTSLQGGKYKIVRHISSGGFGNTYEGTHAMMDTRLAIKEFFVKDFCGREGDTSRMTVLTQSKVNLIQKLKEKFVKEANSIYKLKHNNIVRVTDIFEENDTVYYVMDYVDGSSLSDIISKKGNLSENEALGYIRQIAEALKYVHSKNILHLDVKPGNIMIESSGRAVLIDFGASKHYDEGTGENTTTMQGVNTPGYAPIEQASIGFTSFSPSTDIYALGATLYKALTGKTPPNSAALASGSVGLAPLPANISSGTRNAIRKAMEIKRDNRPQTIDEFLNILGGGSVGNNDENTLLEGVEVSVISGGNASAGGYNNASSGSTSGNYAPNPTPGISEVKKGGISKVHIALGLTAFLALVLCFLLVMRLSKDRNQQEVTPTEVTENVTENSTVNEVDSEKVEEPIPEPEPVQEYFKASDDGSFSFSGNIGGSGIYGTLRVYDYGVSGTYYYSVFRHNQAGHEMSLEGSIDEGGYMNLDAYTPDGDYAENWSGNWNGTHFSGTFIRDDGREMRITINKN